MNADVQKSNERAITAEDDAPQGRPRSNHKINETISFILWSNQRQRLVHGVSLTL